MTIIENQPLLKTQKNKKPASTVAGFLRSRFGTIAPSYLIRFVIVAVVGAVVDTLELPNFVSKLIH